ncbi:TPA: baseplate protein [Enterobacter hormaechei subsp. xiangfangensis]|nr:baseplate protein [Enterobacter hormaechei subsp. xiangfangensis]
MATNTYSRLDDRSVEDPILRAIMHREILTQANSYDDVNNFSYEIKLDEVWRSDLAAYRAWGSADLGWVIRLIAGHENLCEELQPGTIYSLPSAAWIRDRVRHYTDTPEIQS